MRADPFRNQRRLDLTSLLSFIFYMVVAWYIDTIESSLQCEQTRHENKDGVSMRSVFLKREC